MRASIHKRDKAEQHPTSPHSESHTQLQLYIGLRAAVYLLLAGGDVVAVEIIGDAGLGGERETAGKWHRGQQRVTDAVTVKGGIGEGVAHAALVAVDAAVVIVGVEIGEGAPEMEIAVPVAQLLADGVAPAVGVVTAVDHLRLRLGLDAAPSGVEVSLQAVCGVADEGGVRWVVLLSCLDAVAELPRETAPGVEGRCRVVPTVRGL